MEQNRMTIDPAAALSADGVDMTEAAADPAVASDGAGMATTSLETASEQATDPAQATDAMYLPVYNGEVCPVRVADRQEVTTLLQLGMKQRDFLPVYERLTRLAGDAGAVSVKAFVEQLYETEEEKRLQSAMATFGEEHGKRVYELEREKREQRYAMLAQEQEARENREKDDRQARTQREFEELRREYPAYTAMHQLPATVVEQAGAKHISLLDAYNRFVLAEQRRAKAAEESGRAAAVGSTGSLAQQGGEPVSAEREAFLRGLYSRA